MSLGLAGGFAGAAHAQASGVVTAQGTQGNDAVATSTNDDPAIVITGTRLTRPNIDSPVPVTSVDVEELTNRSSVSLGDAINLLPSMRSTISQANANRGIGTSGLNILDLRGLGSGRTLLLVNGRRHVTATPGGYEVDVNQIPTDLVERIDVVTGGNSAVYGSDAIAGVVNFILRRDFEGLRVRGQSSISDRGDRGQYFVSLTAGKNFADGRGNVAVALEYANAQELLLAARDKELGALTGVPNFYGTEYTVGESPLGNGIPDTTYFGPGLVRSNNRSLGGFFTAPCPAAAASGETPARFQARRALNCTGTFAPARAGGAELGRTYVFNPDGSLVPNICTFDFRTVTGTANCIGGQGMTGAEANQIFPALTRYNANLLASYEFSPAFRPFLEAKYVRVNVHMVGQPTFNGSLVPATFSINNPFLTDQARSLLQASLAPGATSFTSGRLNLDFGGRGEEHKRETYRIVAGVEGEFNGDWRYEVAFNYGHLKTYYDTRGHINLARYNSAVNAVRNPQGEIVCAINADANPNNNDPACVPLNLFGFGKPSPQAVAYVQEFIYRNQKATQLDVTGFVSGDSSQLFELPGGPVQFSLGGEYRRETARSAYNSVVSNPVRQTFLGVTPDFTPPDLDVKEAFGEIRIPLLANMPLFHELSLEGAARVSDSSFGGGTVWSYNAGAIWAPVRDLRFRAAYARAVRAPNLGELFTGETQTGGNPTDPCDQRYIGNNPNRTRNCAAAGVPVTEIDPITGKSVPWTNQRPTSITGALRGNPNLLPEVSKSITVGFAVQPRFLPGFSLSLDYYSITVRNVIAALDSQSLIDQCYDSPDGIDNQFCAAVSRRTSGAFKGTFSGQLNKRIGDTDFDIDPDANGYSPSFFQGSFNYAKLETSGIDVEAAYRTRLGSGGTMLNMRGLLSWVEKRNYYPSITDPDYQDRFKGELNDPEWRATFTANLDLGKIDLGYELRWIGKQTVGLYEVQNSVQGRPPENPDAYPIVWYPDVFYHNLRVNFEANDRFRFYAGVDNVLDKLPPYGLSGTGDGSGVFDALGRSYYAGVELKF